MKNNADLATGRYSIADAQDLALPSLRIRRLRLAMDKSLTYWPSKSVRFVVEWRAGDLVRSTLAGASSKAALRPRHRDVSGLIAASLLVQQKSTVQALPDCGRLPTLPPADQRQTGTQAVSRWVPHGKADCFPIGAVQFDEG